MRPIRAFLVRLSALFEPQHNERELAEEIESHLQMRIEDNIRSGMPPAQARRAALIESGGLESAKEACRDVLWMVLRQALWLVLTGVAIGIPAAAAAAQLIASMLFAVNASDPIAISGAILGMFAAAALAAWIPARRATRADPMVVLRYD
jgi:hypothetical protein